MSASVSAPLNPQQIATAIAQSQQIGSSSTQSIASNQFVFFAAFDGTNNIRTDPGYAGTPQTTNVGQMWRQYDAGRADNSNAGGNYYAGPGTPGTQFGSSISPMQQMRETANNAYVDFARQAEKWLATPNPDGTARSAADITTAITGFSRGAPTGVIFAQLLNERGLVAADGTVLIAPGQTPVAAMLLIDPVSTGYYGSLAIPGNVNSDNITVIRAQSEFRTMFAADDYSTDWRVKTIDFTGNHGDAGGFYDQGLGALSLEGSTAFFRNAGLLMAAVPSERAFNPWAPVVSHNEAVDSFGHRIWDDSSALGYRLTRSIDPPVLLNYQDPSIQGITTSANAFPGDDTSTRTIAYKDGRTIKQLLDGDGHVVLTADAGEHFAREAATGVYTVTDPGSHISRSYDPTSQELTYQSAASGVIVLDRDGALLRLTPPANPALAPRAEVEGENYFVAANGALYKELPDGNIVIRDGLANEGVVCAQDGRGELTVIARFETNYNLLGGSTTSTRDLHGQITQTTTRQTDDDGNTLIVTTYADGSGTARALDPNGHLINEATFQRDGGIDGTTGTATETINGKEVVLGVDFNTGKLTSIESVNGSATLDAAQIDAAFQAAGITTSDLIQNRRLGELIPLVTAADPNVADGMRHIFGTADQPWYANLDPDSQTFASVFSSSLSLIAGLATNSPLPTVTGAVGIGSAILKSDALNQIGSGLAVINAFVNLRQAFERGDVAGGVYNVAVGGQGGLNLYKVALKSQQELILAAKGGYSGAGQQVPQELVALESEVAQDLLMVNSLLQGLGQALPFIALFTAAVHHDPKGAIVPVLALLEKAGFEWAGPVGWFATAVLSVHALTHTVEQDGAVYVASSEGGQVAATGGGTNGGDAIVLQAMNNLLGALQASLVDMEGMGIIAQRLPELRYSGTAKWGLFTMYYRGLHADGQLLADTFDADGNYYKSGYHANPYGVTIEGMAQTSGGEISQSKDFYKTLGEQFQERAYAAGAVAPMWMVQTVDAQARLTHWEPVVGYVKDEFGNYVTDEYGNVIVDPDAHAWVRDSKAWTAGFDTHHLAAVNGWSLGWGGGDASPGNWRGNTKASQQTAGVIVLDLDGNGIPIGARDQGLGVLLDVDDDGSAERMDWINPRDGVLVLDRNGDGQIKGGHEMFSDVDVNMGLRGLHALDEIDANRDGKIDASDFVFGFLRVWQDINHDGLVQTGELSSLAERGISAVDINTGQYSLASGGGHAMSEVLLQADVAGVTIVASGLSLLEKWETGESTLMVSAVRDYASAAGTPEAAGHVRTLGTMTMADEAMDGLEDVVLRVGVAQLLENDHGSGTLALQSTGSVVGGTLASEGGGQVLVLTPSANFNGRASFQYTVVDQAGSRLTATAYIDVAAVADGFEATNAYDQHFAGWWDMSMSEQTQGEGSMTILTYRLPEGAILGAPVANTAGINTFSQTDGHWIGYRDGIYYWGSATTSGATAPSQWQAVLLQSPNSGKIVVSGGEISGALTYEVFHGPKYGELDSWDSTTGRWHYSSSDVVSFQTNDGGYKVLDDAFVVRVKDSAGQFTDVTVQVVNPDIEPMPVWSPGDTGGNGGAKPIVLDLAGDGFQFISADDSKAFYDFTGDAARERTGWVGPREGLLAFDANNDGRINLREEIQFTSYVPGATTDLAGLVAFDTNLDGRLTSADAQWSRFFVWQDLNGDGEQTPDEIKTLAQWGIASVSLSSDGIERNVEGTVIHGVGSFTRIDGSTSALADVGFSVSEEAYSATPDDDLTAAPEGGLIASGAGADTVQGGVGADDIHAGSGDDIVTADAGSDQVHGDSGADLIDGGAGADTLWGDGGADGLWGGDGADELHGGNGSDRLYGGADADVLNGDPGNDMLSGDAGDDQLNGGSGVDVLYGGDGNDRLDGGTGGDRAQGGAGNDVYYLDNAQDVVIEAAGEGTDVIVSSADVGYTRNVEVVVLVESEAIGAQGNADANKLYGNQADNVLDGGAGADRMDGGAGNDRYVVDDVDDVVIERSNGAQALANASGLGADNSLDANFFNTAGHVGFAGGSWGIDTVEASISYTLGANVEDLVLVGYASLAGTGNALDNEITGNLGANVLDGAGGNDVLRGGGGADVLIGGTGSNTYVFESVAGSVVVRPTTGEVGHLRFDGMDLSDLTFSYAQNDLLISMGTGKQVRIEGYKTLAAIQTTWHLSVGGVDHVLGDLLKLHAATPLAAQTAIEASPFTWTVPADAFVDLLTGAGNPPVLSATLANGAALPSWLHFDAASRTFSGTPGDADVANLAIKLTAVDTLGDSATSQVSIQVENVNQAPVVAGPVARPNVTPLRDWHYVLPVATFSDPDAGDVLHYSATLADGSPLPGWLSFDAATHTFSGMASPTDAGLIDLRVTATDNAGARVNLAFEIKVLAGQVFRGTTGDDLLTANIGSDTLVGLAGNDTLIGLSGNDSLVGGTGIDSMAGGAGDDIYDVDDAGDVVIEAADSGQDVVKSSISYVLPEQIEDLTLTGTAAIDATGNAGDNVIRGNAMANRIDGAAGADSMLGGNGDDTYLVDNEGDTVTESGVLGGGIDTVLAGVSFGLSANVETLVLTGTEDLQGWGNSQANTLVGNSGANWLDGGAGIDTLVGGAGDDGYGVDNVDDVVVELQDGGTDTVEASVSYTLSDWVENLTLTGTRAINATGNTLDNTLYGNAAANRLDGGVGADTMAGQAGNDVYVVDNVGDVVVEDADSGIDTVETSITYTLGESVERLTLVGTDAIDGTGNSLANTLTGNAASNRLDGGAGADNMAGGEGDDTYWVDNTADVVTELVGGGFDTVHSLITYKLRPELEKLVLDGTAAINGTGNELANVLVGNLADNRLDGGLGADTLTGGAGNDTYVVDDVGDTVTELAGEGVDLVESSISYVLGGDLENLTLTGSAAIDGTGNALANTLKGNSGGNRLDGGLGADTLIGGAGNDVFIVDDLGDVVIESGSGTDRVESAVSFVLGTNIEALVLTGVGDSAGTGNTLANTITGNAGANRLDGGTGADTLQGGAGNDTYVVDNAGDLVIEGADGGLDTVESALTYTLGADLENLVLTGTKAINGTGNELANTLTGNAAANRLDGGAGADTLSGGAGNDVYVVDASDMVIEADGEGVDTVESAFSYTLGAFLEKLVLTGTSAIDGVGNGLDNTLTGNASDNILDGGAGADSMVGGLGNDTYRVDNAADVTTEAAAAGTDTVISTITWKLATNLENLTLAGSANIDATGNTVANVLTGNDGNNVLSGGAGADSMAGGLGDDTYVVDVATDVVTEGANAGIDLVQSAVTYTLGANLENLSLTGTGAINGTGNTLDNVLTGNNGKNVLNGGAGNDTLDGGLGNDTLDGGSGNDVIVLSTTPATGNVDTIQNFSVADDTIQLLRTVFADLPGTGSGPLDTTAFWAGTTAHDADDRIVFDSATGKLWYDADGNGATAAVQIAVLVGVVGTVTYAEFAVA